MPVGELYSNCGILIPCLCNVDFDFLGASKLRLRQQCNARFSHIINKASKNFRHSYDMRSFEKKRLNLAKKRAFARACELSEPLQNRGSRVRILLPLPNKRTPIQSAWCSFVSQRHFAMKNPTEFCRKAKLRLDLRLNQIKIYRKRSRKSGF